MRVLIVRLNKIITALTRHLQVKLVLLLLAAVSWFFVHTSEEMEIEFDLPLELQLDLAEGRTLVTRPPAEVQVLLRGKGRSLLVFALFGEGLVRVEGGRGGESVPLTSRHVELIGAVDLSVAGILPAILPLEVDRLETRRLPVRLKGRVEAGEGWVLTELPELNPGHVKVTGPRSVLDTLSQVETVLVELPARRRDVEEVVPLQRPWPSVDLEPAAVTLHAAVERRAERRFTGIPLRVLHLPAPLSVRPRQLALTVVGGEKALAAFDKDQIEAVLDFTRLAPDQREAPCRIIVPEGFSWTNPDPALFRILGKRSAPAAEAPDTLGPPAP
ncbi:MAG: YbbR-like domain-containing protein [bacterium]|jgi:hypothetical protein|nr:YbbR-like domain-containing protein [bacterium]